jgi:hypothetical protein
MEFSSFFSAAGKPIHTYVFPLRHWVDLTNSSEDYFIIVQLPEGILNLSLYTAPTLMDRIIFNGVLCFFLLGVARGINRMTSTRSVIK